MNAPDRPFRLIHLVVPPALVLMSLAGPGAGHLPGQVPPAVDGQLPRAGEVWFELSPTFESWSEQFAAGSDSVADGEREPLYSHFDGPLSDRLFPGPGLLTDALNRGADSLGYGPVGDGDVSLGSLDFRSLTARRTAVPLHAIGGVTSWMAVELGVDFVQTRTEAVFAYDSTGAMIAQASVALPEGSSYLDDLAAARQALQNRVDSGELSDEQEAEATALLANTGAFATVLERRLSGGLLPLVGSTAGDAMASLAADFQSRFQSFDIEAPDLGLSSTVGRQALQEFFGGPFMDAGDLAGGDHGLQPARLTAGLRLGLLDTFSRDDSASPSGLRLRTTAGVRVRWPLGEPDAAPFLTPASFLDTPVGSGTRTVEFSLYQDLAVGAVRAAAAAGYGKRLADEVRLRVHPPDRPFAAAATLARLQRSPGDYLWLRFSPRLALNPSLSLGGEYAYWNQAATEFEPAGSGEGDAGAVGDPDLLGGETEESRHDVGVGVYYTAAGADSPADSRPVQMAFTYRLAVAGSGGRTPSSNVIGVRLRVPIGLF